MLAQNGSAAQRNARNAAAADARTVRNVQAQRIVPDGDWDAFMASARTTLPACIRINGSGKFAEAIREELRNNFVAAIAGLSPEEADGETITPPFALPWCAAALLGVAKALRRGIRRSRRRFERPNPFALRALAAGIPTRWRGRSTTAARRCALVLRARIAHLA
jgi:hypothetical protein